MRSTAKIVFVVIIILGQDVTIVLGQVVTIVLGQVVKIVLGQVVITVITVTTPRRLVPIPIQRVVS